MRLENLLSLTGATLLSRPDITHFEEIVMRPTRVKRGDLFVAYDPRDIPHAVANGAYAILFESDEQITDPEIAWLKVDSVDEALLRLLRFHLLGKSLNAVACDAITLALAEQIVRDEHCCVMKGSLKEELRPLWELPEESWVLFPDRKSCHDLFVNAKSLPHTGTPVQIIEQTLFETSFILDGEYYERQMLSPFFLPYLNRLVQFLSAAGLHYVISGMQSSSHFVPVFVGDDLQIKTFGQGSRVLIFEDDLSLMLGEIDFIASEAKWAKIIYLVPETHRETLPDIETILSYRTEEDIINILKSVPFHFAVIGGQKKSLLERSAGKPAVPTLF